MNRRDTAREESARPDDYFIGVDARELERLRDQHAAWRSETESLWASAGFGAGQHLVDLGSGPGFTALDLAQRVGPTGRVAALDKASAYLDFVKAEARRRHAANVYTVEADITQIDAIDGHFDGAFCRFFLAFLIADLDAVLSCIYRSLKPGGVFAAMEYLTLASATCSPPVRGFDAHTQAWIRFYSDNGGDTAVGSYLPAKMRNAGFRITHSNCVGGMARSGTRLWHWWGRLMADFGDKLAAGGLMTAEELRQLREGWAHLTGQPDAFIHTPVLMQLVGRKD